MDNFTFRPAYMDDLDELVRLEKSVAQALPSPAMFAVDERPFYESILQNHAGSILLAHSDDGRLAGVSVIRFPAAEAPDNLGHDLHLPAQDLASVQHLESVFIRSDCRHQRLAMRLISQNMCRTQSQGRCISAATVWPLNRASLQLHFDLGMRIHAFAFKYGGHPRFILLHRPEQRSLSSAGIFVSACQWERHQQLLAQGMEGTGIQMQQNCQTFCIRYQHP